MKRKIYQAALDVLQAELAQLQSWVVREGARICVLFEGRDAAGKGGTIRRITERLSGRVFRVVALPKPSDRESTQWYFQRYIEHLPAAGEVVLFDRSWYNRAGVERVMGFATEAEYERFIATCPRFEETIIGSGITLVKYWLTVSAEEQRRRFQSRIDDPAKRWKLSPMDLESRRRWYAYSRARDAMFAATSSPESPWYVIDANDQKQARLDCIRHLLSLIPYASDPPESIVLPPRDRADEYDDVATLQGLERVSPTPLNTEDSQ